MKLKIMSIVFSIIIALIVGLLLNLNGIDFVIGFIPTLISSFVVFVATGIGTSISDSSKNFTDKIGGALKTKVITEPKAKKIIEDSIQVYKTQIKDPDSLSSEYKIKFVDKLSPEDTKFSLFNIPKNLDTNNHNSIILQLPLVMSYKRERHLLEYNLSICFFDKLAFDLAQQINPDYATEIMNKIERENRSETYEIIENIMNDQEKYQVFMAEIRRRLNRIGSRSPEFWQKKELSAFARKLRDGLFKIMLIGERSKHIYIKFITDFVKNVKYKGLYCLAIGQNTLTLGRVKREIESNYNNILELDDDDLYSWFSEETQKKSMGRTTIFKKRDVSPSPS